MGYHRVFYFENGETIEFTVDSNFKAVFDELADAMDKNGKIVDMWEY